MFPHKGSAWYNDNVTLNYDFAKGGTSRQEQIRRRNVSTVGELLREDCVVDIMTRYCAWPQQLGR